MLGAVFFDRDGVLNVDTGYLHDPAQFEWVPGARDAIRMVREAGLLAIVVTNQSGVARGYYDEAAMHRLHDWMNVELGGEGLGISAFYHCPYHDTGSVAEYVVVDHPDRKPNPGMILRAMSDFGLDPVRCLIIGDKDSDVEAGRRAGIPGVLFTGGRLDDALRPAMERLLAG